MSDSSSESIISSEFKGGGQESIYLGGGLAVFACTVCITCITLCCFYCSGTYCPPKPAPCPACPEKK